MAKLPEPLHNTVTQIYKAYEADADNGNRPHLGASLIGHHCERYLWLTFRWTEKSTFEGRMLRLFETGQLEEARMVANLRRVGITVHDVTPDGQQWRVSAIGDHFGGSMDGAAVGFPEAPKKWHVIEFKTHNEKSFKDLVAKRVQSSKPQHYAQMQTYMGMTGMDRAYYLAKNKNNDELYGERVEFDQVEFSRLMARAERIIEATEPPARISRDASWYQCKMCDKAPLCHGTDLPQVNCRTCMHSTPLTNIDGAKWRCEKHEQEIPADAQQAGCGSHRYIPIMLENIARPVDSRDGDVAYELPSGEPFVNGEAPDALTSAELRAMKDKTSAAMAAKIKSGWADVGVSSTVTG